MIKITFTSNSKRVKDKIDRLRTTSQYAAVITPRRASLLIGNKLRQEAPVWRGYLKDNIRVSSQSPTEYRVTMPRYWRVVDEGRKPGKVPGPTIRGFTKLQLWAADKGINYWALRKSIAKKGTMPTFFVQRAVQAYKNEVKEILKNEAKEAVRKSGLGKYK